LGWHPQTINKAPAAIPAIMLIASHWGLSAIPARTCSGFKPLH
jgi:hypothetical protein